MSSGMGGGTLGSGHCQLANQPLVMPVFPLRASQPSPVPVYSPSRFHIDKRCQHRCTWKCLAIAMICLCVILAAMLAYFIGKCYWYIQFPLSRYVIYKQNNMLLLVDLWDSRDPLDSVTLSLLKWVVVISHTNRHISRSDNVRIWSSVYCYFKTF